MEELLSYCGLVCSTCPIYMATREIVEESLKIASEICIYTNQHITIEEMETN